MGAVLKSLARIDMSTERELRAHVPREIHAELHGPRDRDPVAILAEFDAERIHELVPERYKRMVVGSVRLLCAARRR